MHIASAEGESRVAKLALVAVGHCFASKFSGVTRTCCYTVCKHGVEPVVPASELLVLGHESVLGRFRTHGGILAQPWQRETPSAHLARRGGIPAELYRITMLSNQFRTPPVARLLRQSLLECNVLISRQMPAE